jgi:enoyl-CoA hydratase/carnithine racemase
MTGAAAPSGESVLLEVQGSVALITLNRPAQLNAWTFEMKARFYDIVAQCELNQEVRVLVVTGAGRGFCAGMDINALGEVGSTAPTSSLEDPRPNALMQLSKPVIAAINGACVGVGFVIASACDIRFAADSAKIGTMFARRGLPAEDGVSWTLPRILGTAKALDLLLSGRTILGREAADLGYVSRSFPEEELLPATLEYARDLAANCSPAAMAMIKRQVYADLETDERSALRRALDVRDEAIRLPDFDEGVAAYRERRTPRFPPPDRKETS